jgi:hypothetical protein
MTHAGDPDFLAALDELRALHLSKGHDYADATDPLRNYVESSRDCGVQPWRGAMLRLSEKYHRLTNLIAKDATPNFESLEDTLMDMAALALIVRSLRRRQSAPLAAVPEGCDRGPNPGDPPEVIGYRDIKSCTMRILRAKPFFIESDPDATGDSISPEPWGDLF